jgi:hypothetical protein
MRITGHKDLGLMNGMWGTQWFIVDGEFSQTFITEYPDTSEHSLQLRYQSDRAALGSHGISPKEFDAYATGHQEVPQVKRFAATEWNPMGGE